ncbi:MAG: hypothetical protein CMD02_00925 [Flavobacteriales bacterium]|nr:hypothetical protein [Flavobacteriales bacterium]
MARQAEFIINGTSIKAELKKVDRKKIYGWSSVEVFDENGSKCKLASISDGIHVLPSGSSSLLKFNDKGETVSSSDLVGFNQNGEKVEKVPSIYDGIIELKESTIDDYLSLAVKTVYQLNMEDDTTMLSLLKDGKVLYFVFNYRADYEGDDAFLISNGETAFVVTGKIADLEFIGMNDNEKELVLNEEESSEEDELDFAMF